MKKNAKKKSTARKLLPAFAMLTVSAISLSSATYAWFTMNKEVEVTGMMMRTTVGSNLLISEDNSSAASYKNNLQELRACTLEPSSSNNGINFFWTSTSNVDAAGNAIADTYTAYNENTNWTGSGEHDDAGKTAYDTAFNTNYGIITPAATYEGVAYGYLDYTFYLKAVNTEATAQDIKLTGLNFLYNGAKPQDGDPTTEVNDKAWRVALMAKETSLGTTSGNDPGVNDVVSIFTIDGATNFESTAASGSTPKKDLAIGTANAAPKALSYGSSWNDNTAVDYYNKAGQWGNIASGAEKYYKVVVRMWLEGEDTTCTNQTYALLKNDYTLDLKFEFSQGTAVTNIGSSANATISESGGTLTAGLVSGTGNSYQWYNFSGHTAIEGGTSSTYTPSTSGTYYCIITNSNGNTYVTPVKSVTVS